MPTLFDQTWQDNAGDTVSASDLNSHAGEHSDALFDVAEAGTVIGGVGRDQPINITGSGASVSQSNGEIVVDVTDTNTDTQLSNEQVEDIVAGRLSGGSNVTVTHDDPNNTITVDATDTDTDTRVETQAGGTQQYADTSVVNFDTSSDISVTDNGGGKITVAASGGGGGSVNSIDPQTVSDTPNASGSRSVCIGPEGPTDNGASRSVVIGPFSKVKSSAITKGIAIGNFAVSDVRSVAIGAGTETGEESIGIGVGALPFARHSISLSTEANTVVDTESVARLDAAQLVFGANNGGTIANADLNNQELTVQANSAEDALTFRYKTSGGAVKTGTLSLT